MTLQTQDEAARRARVAYFLANPTLVEEKAQEQAKADRSDPFTYSRVRSHYRNGIVLETSDYDVEWGREVRNTSFAGRDIEYVVAVPRNVKRP